MLLKKKVNRYVITKFMSLSLREAVQKIISELIGTESVPQGVSRPQPPPLPAAARQQPASAALPKKGALHKFKASLNMAADAGARAKEASEQANTKEALRWLDKTIEYATAAKKQLIP